jgi:phage gp36-like protein
VAYATEAQIKLAMNTNEVDDFADDDADGTADTGVISDASARASRAIWSIIGDRYSATTAMAPEAYTAGAGTYPVLESKCAELAADYLMERQGGNPVTTEHPVIDWAREVSFFLAHVGTS